MTNETNRARTRYCTRCGTKVKRIIAIKYRTLTVHMAHCSSCGRGWRIERRVHEPEVAKAGKSVL